MILEIVTVLLSQFGITGLSILSYHRFIKSNKANGKNEQTPRTKPGALPPPEGIGLVVQEMDEPVEVITEEEHLARLLKMYPEAAKDYKRYHAEKRLLNRSDRYILRMLLAVEAGEMTVKKTSHHMEFSNGDTIWTSNAYYSYGNLDHSPDNPHCIFSCNDGRLSLYTFMRIVHLEETEFEPILRLKNKTIKVVA